jgi:hypothetical protein
MAAISTNHLDASRYWSTANTLDTTGWSCGTITISPEYFDPPKRSKKAETDLEWLDRRVDEMRVEL